MSDAISITLSPGAVRFLSRLKDLPRNVQQPLLRAMDSQNQLTITHLTKAYLSLRGKKTLGVVTNRLRKSVRASKARVDSAGVITATIGSNVKYAAVHEFGFNGKVTVHAHERTIRKLQESHTKISINPATGQWNIGRTVKRRVKTRIQVRSFSRHMRMPQRSFIRRGIKDRKPQYIAALEAAIPQAL